MSENTENLDRENMENRTIGIPGLQSSKSTRRLEQVADLRASGVGDHINLPQIVVCGDQSAGKSSILEGLTGLPFPRQDGICTKFATEIILQHSTGKQSIKASVIPSSSRSDTCKTTLRSYNRQLKSFDELPEVIVDASALMGIRGFEGSNGGPTFAKDVLRIEVSGPIGLHLTVVDLPGLIAVPNDEQDEEDVETVQELVDSYVANPRTIILAVVQAGNDIANQGIIRKSRHVDKAGLRTVGVITKPDLINRGTEKRIALLAKNLDTTKLKLGYFLVKNPTPTELAGGITPDQRQRGEVTFFQSSPWKEQGLATDRVGILSLRSYLQTLLDQHMERELPKVQEEVKNLLKKTEMEIEALGDERQTIGHLRMFLSRIAMRFHGLTTSALNGTYHEMDSSFFSGQDRSGSSIRLRASVHLLNTNFSDEMRQNGQKRKVVESEVEVDSEAEVLEREVDANLSDEKSLSDAQLLVTECEMKTWVKEVYHNSRGKELPGNYNHVLLLELFFIQSSRWYQIAENHLNSIYEVIVGFIESGLRHIIHDERIFSDLLEIILASLQTSQKNAEEELNRLWQDEKQQPITYNHYYTDNVQKSRQSTTRQMIRKAMDGAKQEWGGRFHISNNQVDAEKLLASLQSRITVDMDKQACSEALAGLNAYYKVALKTFVDNVCRQVIERHLLRTLPEIFYPETVAILSDGELERIAGEQPSDVEKRANLRALHRILSDSLRDLRANVVEKAIGHLDGGVTEQNLTNPDRDREKHADPSGEKMKALVWNGKNSVELVETYKPKVIEDRDVILKVTGSTICGSDLHLYHGAVIQLQKGDILGHEFCGRVDSVGPGIKNLKPGDRVVASFQIACGDCMYCQRKLSSQCERTNTNKVENAMYGGRTAGMFGYSHFTGGFAGGQAEYARVPFGDVNLLPLPDDVPDEKGLYLSDVLATSWNCVVNTGVKEGDVVAIWGAGPIGQMCAEMSFTQGAKRVIVIDGGAAAWRLDLIKSKTPKVETINFTDLPRGETVTSKLKEMEHGGPDVALECAAGEYAKGYGHKLELALGLGDRHFGDCQ